MFKNVIFIYTDKLCFKLVNLTIKLLVNLITFITSQIISNVPDLF